MAAAGTLARERREMELGGSERRPSDLLSLTPSELRELRHEIANALAASSGHTQFLLLRQPAWADECERRALLAIRDSLRLAFHLLGIASPAPRSDRVRLTSIIGDVVGQVPQERFDDVRVRCYDTEDVSGTWQRERVMQILLNLLSNAAKYSPAGTPIEVEVSRQPGCVRVIVRDRGIGIPEQHLEAIFSGFRTNRARQRADGSGIGLRVSRRLARAEGGDLWATSVLGEGSAFYLELPLSGTEEC